MVYSTAENRSGDPPRPERTGRRLVGPALLYTISVFISIGVFLVRNLSVFSLSAFG